MKKLCLALLLATAASSSFAGQATGRVVHYLIGNNGMFFFRVDGTSGLAGCNTMSEFALNLNAEKSAPAKAIMASVLAAYIEGKPIMVQGTGACDIWYDRETVAHIFVN